VPRAPESDPPGIPELPPGLIGEATPRAGTAYRVLRASFRVVAWLLRFQVTVEGLEHLPAAADGRRTGGWIAACLPHRTWIDPFLVWMALPAEPRLVFFGDARTMARSPLRRWVVRRVGGILPIPSHGGPRTFATHVAAAGDALAAGTVFCLFPESGLPVPPDRARPIAPGLGYIALRSGARIVPIVLGGNHELYLGRRLLVRIEPALDATVLAWPEAAGSPGPDAADSAQPGSAAVTSPGELAPGSREERAAAHRVADGLRALTADAVAKAHADSEPAVGARKRWTGLTTLFR
jgi:1-acyl-sn-glycerol-3-phosphate acyltransferase